MAKQSGLIRIEGNLGNLTFYVKNGKHFVMETREESKYQRKYKRVNFRKGLAEYHNALKASARLRADLRSHRWKYSDKDLVKRMNRFMHLVVKSDKLNEWGMRNVADGDLQILSGFNFNRTSLLHLRCLESFDTSINHKTGKCTVSLPPIIPAESIQGPEGFTHFKIEAFAFDVDFRNRSHKPMEAWDESEIVKANSKELISFSFKLQLEKNIEFPIFLFVGIQYFTKIGRAIQPMLPTYNCLNLVEIK